MIFVVFLLWETVSGGNCLWLFQRRRLFPKPQKDWGILLLFASSPTPKPFISQSEFAPGKSHILGKGSVHRSDSCFIPSLWFPF